MNIFKDASIAGLMNEMKKSDDGTLDDHPQQDRTLANKFKLPNAAHDISNETFSRLTAIEPVGHDSRHRNILWLCKCICGNEMNTTVSNLRSGNTKSCGCLSIQLNIERRTVHGMHGIPEYYVWKSMKGRIFNTNDRAYNNYGGRGIGMSKSWAESFECFYSDMGGRPSSKHMIDRIDNDGDYTPENCRWVTRTEQNRNKRSNRIINFDGRSMCMAEWAEVIGISYTALECRIRRGWTVERALTTPLRSHVQQDRVLTNGMTKTATGYVEDNPCTSIHDFPKDLGSNR